MALARAHVVSAAMQQPYKRAASTRTNSATLLRTTPSTVDANVGSNAREAREWIAKWRFRSSPSPGDKPSAALPQEQLERALQRQLKESAKRAGKRKSRAAQRASNAAQPDQETTLAPELAEPKTEDSVKVLRELTKKGALLDEKAATAAMKRQLKKSAAARGAVAEADSPATDAPVPAEAPAPAQPDAKPTDSAQKQQPSGPQSDYAPCQSYDDGAVLFTSGALQKVQYGDVKLGHGDK